MALGDQTLKIFGKTRLPYNKRQKQGVKLQFSKTKCQNTSNNYGSGQCLFHFLHRSQLTLALSLVVQPVQLLPCSMVCLVFVLLLAVFKASSFKIPKFTPSGVPGGLHCFISPSSVCALRELWGLSGRCAGFLIIVTM